VTYDNIQNYYSMGLFTADDIAIFVTAGYITQDQATAITASQTS
jgi:uncharacterized XkdX family phage protein